VTRSDDRALRGLLPLLASSVIVVLVTVGLARGFWLSNLHNGLLALAFTGVGTYVLFQRPGHRAGVLFMATGVVEAVMFFGRQAAHFPTSEGSDWLGWLGVWPVAIALALATLSVICFPDGGLPSPRWRPVVTVVVAVALLCALVSAIWPVEYASAGVHTEDPVNGTAPDVATTLWSAVAHPAYVGFQVLWVVAVVARWRSSDGHVRSQLALLVMATGVSVAALVVGLVGWGTPSPGLLSATLIPLTAGWAIVHGQHLAAYSALTWMSRSGPQQDRPNDIARAVAQALGARGAVLWMGSTDDLHAVGLWPETAETVEPLDLESLAGSPHLQLRPVSRGSQVIGVLSVERRAVDHLSLAEQRLFDDLAAHAALVIEHQTLADLIATQQRAGQLDGLSARERDVLDLMARGLSNSAICGELHLSIKTVEPLVSTIFRKLELQPDGGSNRRVLAVLAYLRG
jgi:DNA-binding CsgD family transcriptional regulator